ncbi:integrase [Paenarthrobacter sp. TE4293]|uniref:hypothetical protein n=1 Tax=Paenarthrobacter sp. TE4293 TaxID=3381695 RepID=UPI003D22CEF7
MSFAGLESAQTFSLPMLIAHGLDVKVVQKNLRHSSAKTAQDTYGHKWPDNEETARAAVAGVLADRLKSRTEQQA